MQPPKNPKFMEKNTGVRNAAGNQRVFCTSCFCWMDLEIFNRMLLEARQTSPITEAPQNAPTCSQTHFPRYLRCLEQSHNAATVPFSMQHMEPLILILYLCDQFCPFSHYILSDPTRKKGQEKFLSL